LESKGSDPASQGIVPQDSDLTVLLPGGIIAVFDPDFPIDDVGRPATNSSLRYQMSRLPFALAAHEGACMHPHEGSLEVILTLDVLAEAEHLLGNLIAAETLFGP